MSVSEAEMNGAVDFFIGTIRSGNLLYAYRDHFGPQQLNPFGLQGFAQQRIIRFRCVGGSPNTVQLNDAREKSEVESALLSVGMIHCSGYCDSFGHPSASRFDGAT